MPAPCAGRNCGWTGEGFLPEERGAWGGTPRGNFAVSALLLALGRGRVAAVKGIGGFHLVCDAFSADAVALLRERKNRPRKALAIMAASLEEAERLAFIDGPAREALLSAARPVVVCPRRPGEVPDMLAPGRQHHRDHAAVCPRFIICCFIRRYCREIRRCSAPWS